MNWNIFWKSIFFTFVPLAFLFYLIFRALLLISMLRAFGLPFSQQQLRSNATASPSIALNAIHMAANTKNAWCSFFYGWHKFYMLPYVLLSPGFYRGVFNVYSWKAPNIW